MDFDAHKVEFSPAILATPLRPDIVLWSQMSRVVVLIELTCPAEEGMRSAQLRKETKYSELLDSINATTVWTASLWTLEIGARVLVGLLSRLLRQKLCASVCRRSLFAARTLSIKRTITLPGHMVPT